VSNHRSVIKSARTEQRQAVIRGDSPRRSATVHVLAAYSQHTDCNLATLGFSAGVDFDRLLAGTRLRAPFGQSPFAFRRGLAFEKLLRADNYAATAAVLREEMRYTSSGIQVVNVREPYPATAASMPLRARDTREILERIIRGDRSAPDLVDGAVLSATIGGRPAFFEADALAARTGVQIRVAEVKSFPKVDDRVDAEKLGAALDQVAIYILLAREEVGRLGGDPDRLVSDLAMLITPLNVGMTPTLSVQRVANRITRIEKLLRGVPRAEDVAAAVPAGLSFGPVADRAADTNRRIDTLHGIADQVGTAYKPACLTTCGNALFCRERAFGQGLPCVSGTAAVRLLPGVPSLDRAEELSRGATPASAETPAADHLARAGRLYDTIGSALPRRTA
jgi:hypothetical protein